MEPIATDPEVTPSSLVEHRTLSVISKKRKYVLLFLFAVAQFIDSSNISALFSAVPTIAKDLPMTPGQSVWLISGYQLTFASFLLLVSLFSKYRLILMWFLTKRVAEWAMSTVQVRFYNSPVQHIDVTWIDRTPLYWRFRFCWCIFTDCRIYQR